MAEILLKFALNTNQSFILFPDEINRVIVILYIITNHYFMYISLLCTNRISSPFLHVLNVQDFA